MKKIQYANTPTSMVWLINITQSILKDKKNYHMQWEPLYNNKRLNSPGKHYNLKFIMHLIYSLKTYKAKIDRIVRNRKMHSYHEKIKKFLSVVDRITIQKRSIRI